MINPGAIAYGAMMLAVAFVILLVVVLITLVIASEIRKGTFSSPEEQDRRHHERLRMAAIRRWEREQEESELRHRHTMAVQMNHAIEKAAREKGQA